jgi:multicomponent Na+:H+ antiporter subunit F
MEAVYVASLLGLTLAAGLVLLRLLLGPTASDRIVALDTLLLVVVGGVAVQMARLDEARFAPVLVVVSLLAFVGTTTVARFVEKRTADEESGWAATEDDGAGSEAAGPQGEGRQP